MKTALTLSLIILFDIVIFLPQQATAQSPQRMSYQAVIRNSSNQLVSDRTVGMRISILSASANGTTVYTETQTPSTNNVGLVSIEVGGGEGFGSIDWTNGPYFIKTEIDLNGGTNYTITGTSLILSVPYALHAKTAENVTGNVTETDPVYLASQAANITATDIINLANLSGINTGDQDLSVLATQTAVRDSIAQLRSELQEQNAYFEALVDKLEFLTNTLNAGGFITDIDGNEYNTVKIGNQVWMAENLKTTKYNDGTAIPLVRDSIEWYELTTPGYCWYDNNKNKYSNTYGALYNWYTVNTGNLCPVNWHVPSNDEWTILENYLIANGFNFDDTSDDDGDRTTLNRITKALGSNTNWIKSDYEGAVGNTDYPLKRNLSGFSALPGGIHANSGNFYGVGWLGFWWTSSENPSGYPARFWYRKMHYHDYDVGAYVTFARDGLSVRCVKD